MSKNSPRPLKDHAASGINAFQSAVSSLYNACKGDVASSTPKDRAASGAADNEMPVLKAPTGPLAELLNEARVLAEKLGQAYNGLASDFVLPRESPAGGLQSRQGKLVVPAASTPARFKELFGSEPRKVEAEYEDEVTGEKRVKVEGIATPIIHSYVVAPKK